VMLAPGHIAAAEILLHRGPVISTPDLELHSTIPGTTGHPKELKFTHEFFIGAKHLADLAADELKPDKRFLSATEAIRLASASAEIIPRTQPFPVRKLELLVSTTDRQIIRYYIISLLTDESAETHRVVLMDGTILKPKMLRFSD
jgi:hypothetical protein